MELFFVGCEPYFILIEILILVLIALSLLIPRTSLDGDFIVFCMILNL